jgi:hypothetical protein
MPSGTTILATEATIPTLDLLKNRGLPGCRKEIEQKREKERQLVNHVL